MSGFKTVIYLLFVEKRLIIANTVITVITLEGFHQYC